MHNCYQMGSNAVARVIPTYITIISLIILTEVSLIYNIGSKTFIGPVYTVKNIVQNMHSLYNAWP